MLRNAAGKTVILTRILLKFLRSIRANAGMALQSGQGHFFQILCNSLYANRIIVRHYTIQGTNSN